MEWKEINFEEKTWQIPGQKTKNGKAKPIHLVPWVIDILVRRKQDIGNQSEWVLPSKDSKVAILKVLKDDGQS
jgi:integrase